MVLLKFQLHYIVLYCQTDLHSTMVLLKSIKNSSNKIVVTLSTFHYGSIKILSKCDEMSYALASTFHYGSIKIEYKLINTASNSKSTFHYGSIKIIMLL